MDAKALGGGHEYADVQVLTVVALRHLSAQDAVARLQGSVPEDVRLSHVGETSQILIQGPGHAVAKAIQDLERIDVR